MFEIKNMDIYIYPRYLIKNLSLTLNKGDKLAIIGEEGNGKSTLLKCILGICDYAEVKGTIITHKQRIGYLEQSTNLEIRTLKVYDYLFTSDEDYYNKINSLYKYLDTLKINDCILEQAINTLSGGESVKIRLLKILLDKVDILILDEPTNDLDIATLKWLEDFINNINKIIIYVSHDEILLENTANYILHLEQIKKKTECKHTVLKSDYKTYIDNRLRLIEHQRQIALNEKREFKKRKERLESIMNKVENEQNNISRGDPHGARMLKKKMKSLKAQERKNENIELTEIPDVEESINFFFDDDVFIPKNKIILKLELEELKINKRIFASNINLDVIGPEHVCIIGKNGCGKTTLMRLIYENLRFRDDIKLGYMPQNYDDILGEYDNVLDYIAGGDYESITRSRMYLGNMHFTREEMTGKIKDLSNGTKAKLVIMKLVLDGCNVLLLDEPTRNVSPLSNPIIRSVLKEFKGTIISVSHDRKYLSEVADKVYQLTSKGLVLIDK